MNADQRTTLALLLAAGLLAMAPPSVRAQSRCEQLAGAGWASCLEARASSISNATISFDDGNTEYLVPTGDYVNAPPTVVNGITYHRGSRYGTYPLAGLNPDRGPQALVEWVAASGGQLDNASYVYSPQQATPAYLTANTPTAPTMSQASVISTHFGRNQAAVELTGSMLSPFALPATNLVRPGVAGTVSEHVLGSAQSIWIDTATFAANDHVSFSVDLHGSTTAASSYLYTLTATDAGGNLQTIASVFNWTPGTGVDSRQLSGFLDVVAGEPYRLESQLVLYVQDDAGRTDFGNTAQLSAIRLGAGNSVSFASGSADWNGIATTVPEPASTALLLAGLGALGLVARRRRPG